MKESPDEIKEIIKEHKEGPRERAGNFSSRGFDTMKEHTGITYWAFHPLFRKLKNSLRVWTLKVFENSKR